MTRRATQPPPYSPGPNPPNQHPAPSAAGSNADEEDDSDTSPPPRAQGSSTTGATSASAPAVPVLADGAARTTPVLAGGRAATLAGVVPADAPPGATARSKPASDFFGSFPDLLELLTTRPEGRTMIKGRLTIESAITVTGLQPAQIEVLRQALLPRPTLWPRPIPPSQLNYFIKLRKQFGAPLSYEQLIAIRAADSARCGVTHDDDDRYNGGMHRNYNDMIDERRATWKLGTGVIFTEATMVDSETNSATIVATVRPETTAQLLDSAENLNVRFHISRSLTKDGEVLDEYKDAVEELKRLFVDKIAMLHVRNYGRCIVDSGRTNWTNATSLPLSPAAAARMSSSSKQRNEPPIPLRFPASSTKSRRSADSKHAHPADTDDLFSPRAPSPADANCGACSGTHDDSIPSPAILEAYERAAYHARGAFTPSFPVELALAFEDERAREVAFGGVRDARGDAAVIFSTLMSMGLCGRHALKLASSATEDIFHGFGIIY